MKTICSLFKVFPLLFLGGTLLAQGSKNTLEFDGNDDFLQMSAPLNLGLISHTVEAWIKIPVVGTGGLTAGERVGVLLGNYNSAAHLNYEFTASGQARVYSNSGEVNANGPKDLRDGLWHHVAFVKDKVANQIRIYIDGNIELTTSTVGADLNTIVPFRIGGDNRAADGGYNFHGQMDEIRIWSVARTETEIRNEMCKTLTGTEASLQVLYHLDETTGTTITDASGNISSDMSANMTPAARLVSGAPLGDESTYSYNASWSGISQSLTSPNGNFMVDGINGTLNGIHVYKVNGTPTNQSGIPSLNTNQTYFGVFTVNDPNSTYAVSYDYSGYADAVTNENYLGLFNRHANNSSPWNTASATVDTPNNRITLTDTGRTEIVLGFNNGTCDDPVIQSTTGITGSSAIINWITGNASSWTIEYGLSGFTPGTGQIIVAGNTGVTINGLISNTSYDFYISADCGTIGASSLVGPQSFTTLHIPGATYLGPARSMKFDGDDDYIQLNSPLNIGMGSHTFETWVKIPVVGTGGLTAGERVGVLIGSYNSANSINYEVSADGKMRVYWNAAEVDFTSTNSKDLRDNNWHHVAFVRDTTIHKFQLYIDGILNTETTSSGTNVNVTVAHRIGGDRRNSDGGPSFHGEMDEIRVWGIARTAEEIRDYMCEMLSGTENDLMLYYRLNEETGTAVTDLTGNNPGVMTNGVDANHLISGAPIGNDSEHMHGAADWSTVEVTLASTSVGAGKLRVASGSPAGIHLYRVDGIADNPSNLPLVQNENAYYGIFVSENIAGSNKVQFTWDYNSYSNAQTVEADLALLNRKMNSTPSWTINPANSNLPANSISSDSMIVRGEFILATNNLIACSLPSGIELTNQEIDNADISWTNGGSGISNIQWGIAGFEVGSGTFGSNITSHTVHLQPLAQDVTYEFYVQDSCAGGNSPWVGPFAFSGERCLEPSNITSFDVTDVSASISWSGANGSDWTIAWGIQPLGNPEWAIQTGAPGIPATLEGLAQNTTYEYYIRSNCSIGNSTWVGPFQFHTETLGIQEFSGNQFTIFPNPSKGHFKIRSEEQIEQVQLFDNHGREVRVTTQLLSDGIQIDQDSLEAGVYTLGIRTGEEIVYRKIIIE
ncbi:LamG-like jellyroll fold domain-containing protein [Fluviicola sp.]|uniref:LamG-like jellyroll fold domain-containing protein n=1 Tax=Fluviicola sp. TaxID=1917219 RepID=UPI00260B603B|nr:LamG-like jellyroll fold domain-containing protein [Fluviicola sp.]